MKIISNQENRTHLSEIIQLLENADEIIFCVAFLKISGLHILTDILKNQNIKCTFYIGTDFYLTEPKALRKLYEDKHKVFITKKERATYHPKIFYFKKGDEVHLIIGSTNLTNGGLETNIEASFSVSTKSNSTTELEFKELVNSLQNHSVLIDNLNPISEYEKRYLAYRNRHKKADEEFEIDLLEILKQEEQNRLDELLKLEKAKTKNLSPKQNNIKINDADKAEFSQMLEKYIYYTTHIRKSTSVNKDYEDKELVRWYQRMKELIKHEAIPDDLAFQLIDANFPFENAWGDTIKMMWDKNFRRLLEFKEKEQKNLDYTYVLQTKKRNSPYFDLGRWIAQQKQRRKGQHGSAWTDYEEEKMQSINYIWDR
ncbi:MAG: phospholipase D-like domain-containing protein, partial [Saprospiraceae bacterium]